MTRKKQGASSAPRKSDPSWPSYEHVELIEATRLFEEACGPRTPDPYNYPAILADFYKLVVETDEALSSGAVVQAAIDALAAEGVNGPDVAGKVHGIALELLDNPSEGRIDLSDFTHSGVIPAWVYKSLPPSLRRCTAYFRPDHERDVFLTGALGALAACLPNAYFRYGPVWHGLNLYLCVVAESGSGKRALDVARELFRPADKMIRRTSAARHDEWEATASDDEKSAGKEPPYLRLRVAANNSDTEIFNALYYNRGHGVIYESEIVALTSATGRDWAGQFRTWLLYGWPNETMSLERRGAPPLEIDRPTLSLVLSGTERSFADWIKDVEDGLFNRTAFYTFQGSDGWDSQWRDEAFDGIEEALDDVGHLLLAGYQDLTARLDEYEEGDRRRSLWVTFSSEQKKRLDDLFAAQKDYLVAYGLKPLHNYTHRIAVMGLRFASCLTLLRTLDEKGALDRRVKSVEVRDVDFACGMQLAHTYLAHGIELARRLPAPRTGLRGRPRTTGRQFQDALVRRFGMNVFTTAEALDLAKEREIPPRTARRTLRHMVEANLLEKKEHGVYCMTLMAPFDPTDEEMASRVRPLRPVGFADPRLLGLDAADVQRLGPVGDGVADETPPRIAAEPDVPYDASADPSGEDPTGDPAGGEDAPF